MCLGKDTPEVKPPAPPPEVLDQEAPTKKTANQREANSLAIGTKAYRNETGLGMTAKKTPGSSAGPSVAL